MRAGSRHGLPPKSVTFPPASLTKSQPAATSHGLRPYSQNPSALPAAIQAMSSEAAPERRTSWLRIRKDL